MAGIQCIDSTSRFGSCRGIQICDILANVVLVIFSVHDSDDHLGPLTHVFESPHYNPEGCGFDSRWGN